MDEPSNTQKKGEMIIVPLIKPFFGQKNLIPQLYSTWNQIFASSLRQVHTYLEP